MGKNLELVHVKVLSFTGLGRKIGVLMALNCKPSVPFPGSCSPLLALTHACANNCSKKTKGERKPGHPVVVILAGV